MDAMCDSDGALAGVESWAAEACAAVIVIMTVFVLVIDQ